MDVSKRLFEFLWSCPHKEMSGIEAGSGTDYIFEVKESESEKFENLYIQAARGGVDDLEDDELPVECVTWKPNEDGSGVEWTDGPYDRQYPGYDFDGFYERGPKIHIACDRYMAFRKVVWYYDEFLKRMCCADPQPLLRRGYIVCIMKEKEE